MKEIDARGLNCPAPVLEVKTAIEEGQPAEITVLVDNKAAKENVLRFLNSNHFKTDFREEGNDFYIIGKLGEEGFESVSPEKKEKSDLKKNMVMITTDRMGSGDDELGVKLMINFIKTLNEMGRELWRLIFVNNGVKLSVEGSEVVPVLKDLEENGVSILVCGTCLSHFNLLDKKKVGETTNMLDIVTSMQLADKIINF